MMTEAEAARRAQIFGAALANLSDFCGLLQVVAGGGDGDTRVGQRVPMVLTGIQAAYVRDMSALDIVLKSRRVYITTVGCAEDLRHFISRPGASVGIVVQASDGKPALAIEQIIDVMIASLKAFVPHVNLPIKKTAGRWDWPERDASISIISAGASKRVASKAGRATRYTRLHFTEASSYEQGEETFASLLGTMPPAGGQVMIESTPKGAQGFFYSMWLRAMSGADGVRGYLPHFFAWYEHDGYRLALEPGEIIEPQGQLAEIEATLLAKGVQPEALKWYRQKLAEGGGDLARLKQEFPSDPESCWLDSGDQYIPGLLIEQCISYDPVPQFDGWAYAGIDFGRQNDLTVIVTIRQDRRGHLWHVETKTCRRTDWQTQMAVIFAAEGDWQWRRVCVDATGLGSMPSELLQNSLGRQRVELVNFGEQSKAMLATTMYAAFAERVITLREDPELVQDVKAIRRIILESGKVVYDAPRTALGHADRAWALALALQASGIQPPRQQRVERGPGDFANGVA